MKLRNLPGHPITDERIELRRQKEARHAPTVLDAVYNAVIPQAQSAKTPLPDLALPLARGGS